MGGDSSKEKGAGNKNQKQQQTSSTPQQQPPQQQQRGVAASQSAVGSRQSSQQFAPPPSHPGSQQFTPAPSGSHQQFTQVPSGSQQQFHSGHNTPANNSVISQTTPVNNSVVSPGPGGSPTGGDPMQYQHQTSLANLPQAMSTLPAQQQMQNRVPLRLTREAVAATAHNWSKPPIGQGGFSSVYQGRFYNADVAVKVLKIRNIDEKLMFDEELKSLINPELFHKNIVPLLAYCDTNPAFVFPKMKPLSKDRLVRLPLDVRDFVCMDVALGLAHMHQAGWVHSDMKPDNILLEFDDNRQIVKACVGDMGCVKSVKIPVPPFGTIVFLDPGLPCTGEPVLPHPSHDVYSLGVTILCIFTGQIPEHRDHIAGLMAQLASHDPIRADVCRRMLDPDPARRPTCAALAEEFKHLMDEMNSLRGQSSAYFPSKQEYQGGQQGSRELQHSPAQQPLMHPTGAPGMSPVQQHPPQQVHVQPQHYGQQPPPQNYQQQPPMQQQQPVMQQQQPVMQQQPYQQQQPHYQPQPAVRMPPHVQQQPSTQTNRGLPPQQQQPQQQRPASQQAPAGKKPNQWGHSSNV